MIKTAFCLLIQLFLQRSGAVPEPDTHIHVYVPPGSGWQLLIKEEKLQSSTCPREAYICANTQCVLCSVRCPCIIYGPVVTTIWRRAGCRGIFGEEGMDTGAYLGRKGWIQGHIWGGRDGYRSISRILSLKITKVWKNALRTLEQAWANICSMGYQNSNFKI